jgi:hypothetical protein
MTDYTQYLLQGISALIKAGPALQNHTPYCATTMGYGCRLEEGDAEKIEESM